MERNLSLRPTLIGGETAEGDWTVIHEGREIGRIRASTDHVQGGNVWVWNITIPLPMPPWCNGSETGFEAAKDAFRVAWELFYTSLSDQQIAHWHHTQDARK